MPTAFRRHFHRPSEIVIGYDEQVLAADALRKVRDAWGGDTPVRTMAFNRAEPDPANAMMVALGDVDVGGVQAPARVACEMLASALAEATKAPWRFGVRFDHRGVIVRGAVVARATESIIASLLGLPMLANEAVAVIDRWSEDGLHLLTAAWDDTGGRWVLGAAHGFKGDKWMKMLSGGPT